MVLRDVPDHTGDGVEARKIKVSVPIVIKKLLHDYEFAIQRLGNARLVSQSQRGREYAISNRPISRKRDIRSIEKRR